MTYSIPYSFIPGTKARAQEVNANFSYVLDSMGELGSTKLNTSLSNITSTGIDIIKNCTAFRNIGEVISSAIPLNDAGLHLLDGALLSGSGSYGDFVDYIAELYDRTRVYNSNAFTVTGTPTITNDGIASNFSGSNRIKTTFDYSGTTLEIECAFYFSSDNDGANIFQVRDNGNSNSVFRVFLTNTNALRLFGVTGETMDVVSSEYSPEEGDLILLKMKLNSNSTITGKVINYTKSITVTKTTTGTITNSPSATGNILYIGNANGNEYYSGTIDLKQVSINVNGEKIFSGTKPLDIFTTETDWQTSVTNDGVCGKFVYNSTNNTVRLPLVTGIIEDATNLTIVLYYIVVATSTQTDIQVDIDNIGTDLNGKADKDLSNINPTQNAKNVVIDWSMPDYANGITTSNTSGNTSLSYTTPAKGWIYVTQYFTGSVNITVTINGNTVFNTSLGASSGAKLTRPFFADKNDVIVATSTSSGAGSIIFNFFPTKGGN